MDEESQSKQFLAIGEHFKVKFQDCKQHYHHYNINHQWMHYYPIFFEYSTCLHVFAIEATGKMLQNSNIAILWTQADWRILRLGILNVRHVTPLLPKQTSPSCHTWQHQPGSHLHSTPAASASSLYLVPACRVIWTASNIDLPDISIGDISIQAMPGKAMPGKAGHVSIYIHLGRLS